MVQTPQSHETIPLISLCETKQLHTVKNTQCKNINCLPVCIMFIQCVAWGAPTLAQQKM
jgi:hypothetical protein